MLVQDELHDLIHALTPNEKRAFRMQSKQTPGEKNYLRLYEVLDAMPEFSAELFRKKTEKFSFNVAYEKHYLQTQLLRFLRVFHSQVSPQMEVIDILKTLNILVSREQFNLCMTLVNKGRKLCDKFELWHYHLELLAYENRLRQLQNDNKEYTRFIDQLPAIKKNLLEQISLYNKAVVQSSRMRHYAKTSASPENRAAAKRLAAETRALKTLLKDRLLAGKFRTQSIILGALTTASYYSGSVEEAYAYCKKRYALCRKLAHFSEEVPTLYGGLLAELVQYASALGKREECLRFLNEQKAFLGSLPVFYKQLVKRQEAAFIFFNEANILIELRRFDKLLAAALQFETLLRENPELLKYRSVYYNYLQLGRTYFIHGRHRDTLRCFLNIIHRRDWLPLGYILTSHVFVIAMHFERENLEQAESFIGQAEAIIAEEKVDDPVLPRFLRLMRESMQLSSFSAAKKNVRAKMDELRQHITRTNFEYHDLWIWLGRL